MSLRRIRGRRLTAFTLTGGPPPPETFSVIYNGIAAMNQGDSVVYGAPPAISAVLYSGDRVTYGGSNVTYG